MAKKNITISGLADVDKFNQSKIKELVEKEYNDLQSEFENFNGIKINIKKHEKAKSDKERSTKDKGKTLGNRKFIVKMLLDIPGMPIEVTHNTAAADPVKSLRICMEKSKVLIAKAYFSKNKEKEIAKKLKKK